ncbi:hypothetical protein N6F72_004137 [Escherichia coli]|nr:hypothetical protein [Escherichia coli]
MKIENIPEALKIAFKDKRIVVVRGGNMSHRDEIMLSLKDLNIEGIDNIVFYNDSNITKTALRRVMMESINTLFVFDHLDISISKKTYDKGREVNEIRGIGYSYFSMVNDNSYANHILEIPSNNNKVLSFTNDNVF